MKGFRTILVGVATIAISLLETFDIANLVPDQYDELALAVAGALMIGLRLITSTPVGESE